MNYTEQSIITYPGDYAPLFDILPYDISQLINVVQGLMVHLGWARSYKLPIPEERRKEIYLRSLPEMLQRILELDASPLIISRPLEKRLVGICRDFAVMLVAMLRHQGIPARLRVGFAGYFRGDNLAYWDHRIAEYWDGNRWVLVDPQIDSVQHKTLRFKIDPLHITADSPFLLAGTVWQQCRVGLVNPFDFGDSPTDRGMAPIRYALLHDFDALNKIELVGFDAWHHLIDKPEEEVTETDRVLLDEIAKLTTQPNIPLDELQSLYKQCEYGQAIQERLAESINKE